MGQYIGITKPLNLITASNGTALPDIDFNYGPFTTISEACSAITVTNKIRTIGRTVGIITDNVITEYWWKNGLLDSDLIIKIDKAITKTSELINDTDFNTGIIVDNKISTLNNTLNDRINLLALGLIYKEPVSTFNSLATQYPTPSNGWASLVNDVGFIYCYNAGSWHNTGLTAFPTNVVTKTDDKYNKIDILNYTIGDFPFTSVLLPTVNYTSDANSYLNNWGLVAIGVVGDKITDFIPVLPNTYYRMIGYFSGPRSYVEYDSLKNAKTAKSAYDLTGSSTQVIQNFRFKTGSTTYFVRLSVFYVTTYQLYKESNNINDVINSLTAAIGGFSDIDYICNFPEYIFGIDNDSNGFYSREYTQAIYPESLLGQKLDIKLNGSKLLMLQAQSKNINNTDITTIPITLSAKGYVTKNSNIRLIKTKASIAKNKQIRYLAIGDSITDNQVPGLDGQYIGGWCYPSIAKQILMMDNKDFNENNINMLLIGITNPKETQFVYKNTSFTLRGLSEGRGSWTAANYLRHAAHTTTTASGSGMGFDNKAAWDAMGLGRKISIDSIYNDTAAYETYSYTNAQRELIRTTVWGKYHWDYSIELWNAAKNNNLNNIMDYAGTYTGTTSDKALLDTYMTYILSNPINPFYDKDLAKTSGTSAFSLLTYLNRYKTLNNDGTTRLIVGVSAGSKILNSAALNNVDVCTPTHITIELGENDRWWFNATPQNVIDDIISITNKINNEFPTIKVGFVNPRRIGVMYPEYWSKESISGPVFNPGDSISVFKYNMNTIAQNYYGALSEQTNNFFIPCFYVQSPISKQLSRIDINLVTGEPVIINGIDAGHPGIQAYWSMAYQILSWIYYTLTL